MKWEDPPKVQSHTTHRVQWQEEAAELRERPGEWGVIRQFPVKRRKQAYAFQNQVSGGRLRAFRPAASFEATSRTTGTVIKVYARYTGEAVSEKE